MKIRKGVVNLTDNSTKLQTVQVEGLAEEVADNVERYQPFGLSTVLVDCPADGKGSECVIADLGSASMRSVIVADDRRFRPVGGFQGDVVLYGTHDTPTAATHSESTQRIVLTDDGTANYRALLKVNHCTIEINSQDEILIENENATITISASGAISITGGAAATINVPTLSITGNVAITGDLSVTGAVTNAGTNISRTHTHGGVQTGSGTTGVVS